MENSRKYRIIVNCISVKKNAGGAFQIAQNFIKSTLVTDEIEWHYWLSEDLLDFKRDFLGDIAPSRINVFPNQPDFKKTYFSTRKKIRVLERRLGADLIYTIASPSYFSYQTKEVLRYANAWFVNLNDAALSQLNKMKRLRLSLLTFVQHFYLKKAKYILTQTHLSRKGLLKVNSRNDLQVSVVPNTLPNLYHDFDVKNFEESITLKSEINILYIAVPHPHKNLNIIPDVILGLNNRHPHKTFKINLTLPEGGFLDSFRERCIERGVWGNICNHGYLKQQELANLYQKADIMFFPSLLETFSLSLLESIYFRLPMVVSDLDFNLEIAGETALYFSPNDPETAILAISELISDDKLYLKMQNSMASFFKAKEEYFSYDNSFRKTLEFFKHIIKGQ